MNSKQNRIHERTVVIGDKNDGAGPGNPIYSLDVDGTEIAFNG